MKKNFEKAPPPPDFYVKLFYMKKLIFTSIGLIGLALTSSAAAVASTQAEPVSLTLFQTVCSTQSATADIGNGESITATCRRCASGDNAATLARIEAGICAQSRLLNLVKAL
ncbi:MAG: hypothetical protein EAY75_00310 [Bacteroidetes bacterium]|nr:MAG: hypothetical protein EAY75_00310 [Bacteroidota bacterium]